MVRLNRDIVVACVLLALCGIFWWSSLSIRDPGYGTLAPAAWPQAVLVVLTGLCIVWFAQVVVAAVRAGPQVGGGEGADKLDAIGFLREYRNPILCFIVYFVFLLVLPLVGALAGGIALVFVLLSILGGWAPRQLALHAAIAVLSMGAMWSLFTYGLRVILPEGILF